MFRMAVMYPRRDGARFDEDYFVNSHLPMLRERLVPMGLSGMRADRGIDGPGPASPYRMVAWLDFVSREDLRLAMATHGAAIAADTANYTDIEPVIQVGAAVFGA